MYFKEENHRGKVPSSLHHIKGTYYWYDLLLILNITELDVALPVLPTINLPFFSLSDELWNDIRDIVQETGIKTIPIEKKCKKAKWLSEEALQIAVKRREGKSKGEKERYKHLNAEFQRIARRDKKAFFSDQCK